MKDFIDAFEMVHKAGLGLTLHIAEVSLLPDAETSSRLIGECSLP